MPLPNIASGRTAQCAARSKRSLGRCRNPAAFGGKTCRIHGAKKLNAVIRGADHWNFKHGHETLEARRRRVESMSRLRFLVDLGVLGGFLKKRVPGRRPK